METLNPTLKEKNGKFFENYFIENLPDCFTILKTPPEHEKEFNIEVLRPDFLIEHTPTQARFFVECKYNSYIEVLREYNQFALEEINFKQINRFKQYYNYIPVLYFIGVGIEDNKDEIIIKEHYLINIKKIYKNLYPDYAKKYEFSINNFEKTIKERFFD